MTGTAPRSPPRPLTIPSDRFSLLPAAAKFSAETDSVEENYV